MRLLSFAALIALAASLPLFATGCGPGTDDAKKEKEHAHDHDHDHDHGHGGLFGGHVMELGNEEYHAEWAHDDDTGKIDVYILDSTMKKLTPIAAEKLEIKTKVGDKEASYDLEAVNTADGKASQFQVTDKTLLAILTSPAEGAEATLHVTIDGKPFTQKFEVHEHHDH